jgi:CRP/FNR family cyclic AMP-dependent transcriptional regulator
MAGMTIAKFDIASYLESAGLANRKILVKGKEAFFTQGTPADCIFFLQAGRVKLSATSRTGREATVALLSPGEFIGEEAVAGVPGLRMTTATAIIACSALAIDRKEMLLALRAEHALNDLFLGFLLARSMRSQADLIDQLFNSSEKRLARILLLMAEFGKPEAMIPKITQETLAEMVGTTRSRVNFFMNRFRKLGFIEYDGEIRVHQSLLNVILHD